MDGLYDKLGEYANLDELNYLASKLDNMDKYEYNQFCAAMEVGDHTGSLHDIINLTENLDCYEVYPNIEDHEDLGRYYIEELDMMPSSASAELVHTWARYRHRGRRKLHRVRICPRHGRPLL